MANGGKKDALRSEVLSLRTQVSRLKVDALALPSKEAFEALQQHAAAQDAELIRASTEYDGLLAKIRDIERNSVQSGLQTLSDLRDRMTRELGVMRGKLSMLDKHQQDEVTAANEARIAAHQECVTLREERDTAKTCADGRVLEAEASVAGAKADGAEEIRTLRAEVRNLKEHGVFPEDILRYYRRFQMKRGPERNKVATKMMSALLAHLSRYGDAVKDAVVDEPA